ncbi:MAG TPA: hypothetical protein VMJ75_19820 [Candidatus Acidoferrales bacterium]|nr:hypothetical protein [Candidatus Acidoferrales bacterium]
MGAEALGAGAIFAGAATTEAEAGATIRPGRLAYCRRRHRGYRNRCRHLGCRPHSVKDELDKVGPLKGLTPDEIAKKLAEQGFSFAHTGR